MTFYQELQVNQAGSKKLIRESASQREKLYHIACVLDQNCDNRRILLYFCFTLQSGLRRGQQHCRRSRAAGICSYSAAHICAFAQGSPRCCSPDFSALWPSDRMQPIWRARSADCSSMLLRLPCSFCSAATQPRMFNQSTLVLGDLLLYGYDVSGHAYQMRLFGLAVGALLVCAVFLRQPSRQCL